jgi:hypothetical protein
VPSPGKHVGPPGRRGAPDLTGCRRTRAHALSASNRQPTASRRTCGRSSYRHHFRSSDCNVSLLTTGQPTPETGAVERTNETKPPASLGLGGRGPWASSQPAAQTGRSPTKTARVRVHSQHPSTTSGVRAERRVARSIRCRPASAVRSIIKPASRHVSRSHQEWAAAGRQHSARYRRRTCRRGLESTTPYTN